MANSEAHGEVSRLAAECRGSLEMTMIHPPASGPKPLRLRMAQFAQKHGVKPAARAFHATPKTVTQYEFFRYRVCRSRRSTIVSSPTLIGAVSRMARTGLWQPR